jgi:hypothetical protein
MKLLLDDGQEIAIESIKTKSILPNQVVVVKVENLSHITPEVLGLIRNNLKMIFQPARVLIIDKTADIEIYEKIDENKLN